MTLPRRRSIRLSGGSSEIISYRNLPPSLATPEADWRYNNCVKSVIHTWKWSRTKWRSMKNFGSWIITSLVLTIRRKTLSYWIVNYKSMSKETLRTGCFIWLYHRAYSNASPYAFDLHAWGKSKWILNTWNRFSI